jgi:biotin carboxyl carrier protein
MELIARSGEREEKVRVRRNGDHYEVTVGDRTYRVDALLTPAGVHSLRIDGAQHEVSVRLQGEDYAVTGRHGTTAVAVTDPLTHLAAQSHGKGARRQRKVTAYMPGRVVAVLAQAGEAVTAGQGIIVLEAMKMENEIRAEHDGTIAQLFVQPGQAVDTGNPLFELE